MNEIRSKDEVPVRESDGLRSHVLLQQSDDTQLAVTWVELDPGAEQRPHRHEPEQVYVVVQGTGLALLDEERHEVTAGDLVHIRPNTMHGIRNTGDGPLVYVSAATPSFDVVGIYDAPGGVDSLR